MTKILEQSNLVSFKELLMANSIQVDALAQLLIEKGIITQVDLSQITFKNDALLRFRLKKRNCNC